MKISFIGAGNMGSAIIGGVIKAKLANGADITVSDKNEERLKELQSEYGVSVTTNNGDCTDCDILVLCVKPNVIYSVIDEIKTAVKKDCVVVSIAAGQTLQKLEAAFGGNVKIARVMPNTPALVGEGMAAISAGTHLDERDTECVKTIFESVGKAEIVPERLMDAVTGVSGSSPAYVFMFIEAMADAAVRGGMSRDMAYTFAAQSVLGSAKMVLDTKLHPAQLKDMVTSPGGTTIEAVAVLEEEGMRNSVIKAIDACIEKSKSM